MAQQTVSDYLSSLDQVDPVFDADGHVAETGEILLPYVDDRYAGVRRILESTAGDFGQFSRTIYSSTHSLSPFMEHGTYGDDPTV